jgi:hypothetical protein
MDFFMPFFVIKIMINVRKASGESDKYSREKLAKSLHKIGACDETIFPILEEIEQNLSENLTTKQIFRIAHQKLKKESAAHATRYKLKQAIFEFGPTGYPFEKFISKLLEIRGYHTETNVFFRGKCLKHEVDVYAESDSERLFVECKFHNRQGVKSDLKVPMYVKSRVDDIKNGEFSDAKRTYGVIITNTKFTKDALEFAECSGLKIISWDYPSSGNLKELIQLSGLHPITSMTSLSKADKRALMGKNIVLIRELAANKELLDQIISNPRKKRIIIKELTQINDK